MAAAGESGIVGEEVSSAPEMSSLQPCTLGNLKYLPFIRFPPHAPALLPTENLMNFSIGG